MNIRYLVLFISSLTVAAQGRAEQDSATAGDTIDPYAPISAWAICPPQPDRDYDLKFSGDIEAEPTHLEGHLAERYGDAHGVVLFSGTMNPSQFYRDVLGLPPSTAELNVASPYRAEQLRVRQYAGLSTRYADRAQSLSGVCDIVGQAYQAQPGNYLLFLSSFDYLDQVSQALQERWPDMPLWHQQSGMSDLQRT